MSGRRGWTLSYDGFRPTDEGLREALCTLGNGYFATRGAAEEAQADDTHYPGTYVAGLYNRLETTIAGRTITNEDLVNCPNWLPLTFRVGDEDRWFNMRAVGITEYRQTLDMKAGVLLRHIAFTDPGGRRFRLEARRLVHRERPHLAAIEWVLTSPDWSGPVTVRSGLDGSVINAGVARYRELSGTHLDILQTGEAGPAAVFVLARTLQSRIEIAVAARTRLFRDGAEIETNTALVEREGFVANDLTFTVAPDDAVRVEKVAALYTSRDFAIGEAAAEARAAASGAPAFGDLYESHARAQDAMWRRVDVELDTDGDEQAALRLNVFHVAQCISVGTLDHDVGVPARGLHGEAYRGHVFWDELFVFPPLTGKLPELTRSLLKYRYRRLEAARRMAGAAGLRGALFPWQSGSSGREETQQFHLNPRSGHWLPDNSHLQRHVNLAIAYNVWRYYLSTRDTPFLHLYGAEMVVEIGRLFASLATFNEAAGRYEINGVMGPDEYHDGYPDRDAPGLDNNAYTNVMAVWCFTRLLKMLELMSTAARRDLTERVRLTDDEVVLWEDMTRRMTVPFHGDSIISQFTGYDDLLEFDWPGYREKYGDIHRLDRILEAEGDSPNRYKLSKQADVTMLFFLLPDQQLIEMLEPGFLTEE